MKTSKTVRKTFKTESELTKFISENTLTSANVSVGQKYVEYQVEEVEQEAVAENEVEERVDFDVTTLSNKGEVISAIIAKANNLKFDLCLETTKMLESRDMSRANLNAFYNDDSNFRE